ncbi:aryl-sulfate sulfotransferase [Halobaculum litoreum]|uniref:Aryl-sulfate sulfotransferase n=1 Tax=Halobaculum litoreum TaxID=3031998 RepID=A0ABD5XKR9_9EURY
MSRRRTLLVGAAVLALVVAGVAPALGADASAARTQSEPLNPCVGTIDADRAPDATTLVSIQGARGGGKTAAMTFGVAPNGSIHGVHNDSAAGRWWEYDVDPLPNGELLMATTEPGITVVERIDPATGEHTDVTRLQNVEDAHDVDYLGDGEFATVDKGDERNRVLIYDRSGEIVWQWRFDEHTDRFPRDGGGPYGEDWTHVNDVDLVGEDTLVVSVRNFDQVIAIDRATKEIEWTLGADDDYEVLNEQHNPDVIVGENGTVSVLVADSENDRVVEYRRTDDGGWERTWTMRGGGLHEPRDADRLPNGNTLITDRRGHRIVEVTPRGDVVWEVYAPWQPYDAERVGTAPGSDGPTMAQVGATGAYEVTGSADADTADIEACYAYLTGFEGSRLVPDDELWGTGGDLFASPTATPGDDTAADGDDATGDRAWTTVPPESAIDVPGFGVGAALAALAALTTALAVVTVRRRG